MGMKAGAILAVWRRGIGRSATEIVWIRHDRLALADNFSQQSCGPQARSVSTATTSREQWSGRCASFRRAKEEGGDGGRAKPKGTSFVPSTSHAQLATASAGAVCEISGLLATPDQCGIMERRMR